MTAGDFSELYINTMVSKKIKHINSFRVIGTVAYAIMYRIW